MFKIINKIRLGILKKMKFLPAEKYLKIHYEYYTGKKLELDNPVEFNQKIAWLKVFYHPVILNQLVDKYAVRSYVEKKIGKIYLNDMIAVYDKVSDIDFDTLPNKFVIKGVHGCGFNLIVDDKEKLNRPKAIYLLNKWMRINQYNRTGKEWAYKDVKPRLLADTFIEEAGRSALNDYKFYCFNGEPRFLEVHLDRTETHLSGFYDFNFEPLPFRDVKEENVISEKLEKPENFEEMISLARILADKLPFVRVDFYSIKGKTIFGELTFYPGDGRLDFYPDSYNKVIGDYLNLPEIPVGQDCITSY